MSVQSDKWIIKMAKDNEMISPFEDKQIRGDKISFGVSSYGYDARVSDEYKIFTNVNSEIVDPKNFKKESFHLIFLEELNTINELIKYKSNLKPSLNRDICVLP